MAGFIKNLKNPFTGKFIFPVTKTRAVYDDKGNRLDNYLDSLYGSPSSNILINSNFANPVNQRGFVNGEVQNYGFSIDRWYHASTNLTLSLNRGFITLRSIFSGGSDFNSMIQRIEFPNNYRGKELTMSIRYRGGGDNVNFVMIYSSNNVPWMLTVHLPKSSDWTTVTKTIRVPDVEMTMLGIQIILANLNSYGDTWAVYSSANVGATKLDDVVSLDIQWMKLEYGGVATPYVPRFYAEELQLCKRYFRKCTDMLVPCFYANNRMIALFSFDIPLRVIPTMYSENDTSAMIYNPTGDNNIYVTSFVQDSITYSGAYVTVQSSISEDRGTASGLILNNGASICFDAEL